MSLATDLIEEIEGIDDMTTEEIVESLIETLNVEHENFRMILWCKVAISKGCDDADDILSRFDDVFYPEGE